MALIYQVFHNNVWKKYFPYLMTSTFLLSHAVEMQKLWGQALTLAPLASHQRATCWNFHYLICELRKFPFLVAPKISYFELIY